MTHSLLPEVLDHAPHDLIELDRRDVAGECVDLRDIGDAPRHVLEPCFVRLVVWDADDRRTAAGQLLDLGGERVDRDFVAVADVENLADGGRAINQGYHTAHDVADVGETAALIAVPEHGNRLAGERLTNEARQNHSVLPSLPWPDGIEQTADDDRQLALLPVGEREELV